MRVLLLVLTMASLRAEAGRLQVRVTDPSSAVVVNAAVEVTLPGGKVRSVRTDGTGVALFQGLAAGPVQVAVSAPGFKRWTGAGDGSLDAKLELGSKVDGTEVRPKSVGAKFKNWLTSCTRK